MLIHKPNDVHTCTHAHQPNGSLLPNIRLTQYTYILFAYRHLFLFFPFLFFTCWLVCSCQFQISDHWIINKFTWNVRPTVLIPNHKPSHICFSSFSSPFDIFLSSLPSCKLKIKALVRLSCKNQGCAEIGSQHLNWNWYNVHRAVVIVSNAH